MCIFAAKLSFENKSVVKYMHSYAMRLNDTFCRNRKCW